MKEGRAHAVKLEGGRRFAPHVEAIVGRRHPGHGPHRVHPAERAQPRRLPRPGPRRHRRRLSSPTRWRLQEAGAFAVVMEMVPAEVAKRVTHELRIPTVGIGAGPDCDAQVLVWQDMAGLRRGKAPRFVKHYADVAGGAGQRGRASSPQTSGPASSPPRNTRSTEAGTSARGGSGRDRSTPRLSLPSPLRYR